MLDKETVASVLERESQSTIAYWLSCVETEPDIITVPLIVQERSAHLPVMFVDIVTRLRDPLPLATRALMSDAAHEHGMLRRLQGYTLAMMVEESRMLEVSIFRTLQLNREQMDFKVVMMDVMTIADEVDSQLSKAIASYMFEANIDVDPVEA
jgi:hypothetical protein